MFNWLNYWVRSWFGICLLKRGPQDDPVSYTGLALALSLYVFSDLLVAAASSGWKVAWGMTGIDVVVMIILTVALLRFTHQSTRLLQTLTALAGTGGLLGLLVLPAVQSAASTNHESSAMLVIFWLVMMVWSVVVRAHVYRHALSLNYTAGVAVAVVQAMIVLKLVNHWFPQVR